MATDPCGGVGKTGPLTLDELALLWRSVTDKSYWEPFVELGNGEGFEAHGQSFAQHARVSQAVDTTTQSMYVLPFSGQTGDPSSGAQNATVALTFTRAGSLAHELTLVAGTTVEEVAVDFSPLGGVEVHTGRWYLLDQTVGLGPGQAGPLVVTATAQNPGPGYDNPQPGSLRSVVQPGSRLANGGASVVPGVRSHALVMGQEPDVVVPQCVGQYLVFTSGSNTGQVRRISGYGAANPGVDGGTALLAPTTVLRLSAASGVFQSGELVEQGLGATWSATVLYQTPTHLVVDRVSGTVALATVAVGVASGAAAAFDSVDQSPDLVAETGTASWQVLDWAVDLGLAVTNPTSPSGGKLPMLDELGRERRVPRGSGEADPTYRGRVGSLADVVSPRAVLRTINRALAPLGVHGWLREVGAATMPGLYYDGDPSSADPAVAFAYDLDFAARPQDNHKRAMSYLEMRAFFLAGVPPLGLGEFGCAYDAGPSDAYDASPLPTAFFDGYALTQAVIYRTLWGSLDKVRAAGVGFDLYVDSHGGI